MNRTMEEQRSGVGRVRAVGDCVPPAKINGLRRRRLLARGRISIVGRVCR